MANELIKHVYVMETSKKQKNLHNGAQEASKVVNTSRCWQDDMPEGGMEALCLYL